MLKRGEGYMGGAVNGKLFDLLRHMPVVVRLGTVILIPFAVIRVKLTCQCGLQSTEKVRQVALSFQQDVVTKVVDKASTAIQTLIKNQ